MRKLYLIGAIAALLLSSCSTAYQVVETTSPDVKANGGNFDFQGKDLVASYNFWDGAGQMQFRLHNESDVPVYVDLNRSHLVVNGQSFDYYNETETTDSKKATANPMLIASSVWNQYEVTVKRKQKQVVEIPPHSYIVVGGLPIITNQLSGCGFSKSSGGKATSQTFTLESTPLQFRNYVTYSFSPEMEGARTMDNSFYAERVHKLTTTAFKGKTVKFKDCPDDKSEFSKTRPEYPYAKPQNLYIKVAQ